MKPRKYVFFIVTAITLSLFLLSVFGLQFGNIDIKGANSMRFGIDIKGGVEATYEKKDPGVKPTQSELEAARAIIETRLDAKNITDRDVTIDTISSKILVRFPWKSDEKDFDPQKAVAELGQTAKLTFRGPDGNVVIEGKHVKKSMPSIGTQNNQPVVQLELTEEGSKLFTEATGKLVGKPISIFMDEIMISSPIVEKQITGTQAVITNLESMESAKSLSDNINSGALPFSLIAKNCNIISPILGNNALNVMVMAGELAFILVCLFMLIYYRVPGLVACIALLLQVTGQLLALSVPQFTLTLPGIAAVILSMGMGVDANVIVSEHIKEQLNMNKTLNAAIDTGFTKSFSSVFDGNITVIIVAIMLIIFGSGALLSFGYSLLTGVIMNFIAGVTASRLMIKSLSGFSVLRKPQFYGARRSI